MKTYNKYNGQSSNAGKTSLDQAAFIIDKFADKLANGLVKEMSIGMSPTSPWKLLISRSTYYDYIRDAYKQLIQMLRKDRDFDRETLNVMHNLTATAVHTCINKMLDKFNVIIKNWGFPKISCNYIHKNEIDKHNLNAQSDMFIILVYTNQIPDVGCALGSWVVVKRDDNEGQIHVSDGTNNMVLVNIGETVLEGDSAVSYCWSKQ